MIKLLFFIITIYLITLGSFTLVNIILVLVKRRNAATAGRNVFTLALFPYLIFTKKGRTNIKETIKTTKF